LARLDRCRRALGAWTARKAAMGAE